MQSSIGLIGLGVMGSNLSRNIANHKFRITVYNRTTEVMEKFTKEYGNEYLSGAKTLQEFIQSLQRPRHIIILVEAGKAVDAVIAQLKPLLEPGDTILDLGNSNYRDTQRRYAELKKEQLHFIGCGISGGEEGALNGPSLMPGGSQEAWNGVKPMFEAIAARDFSGGPCVTYIGDNGAGHYVKMVHNGIEYAVMQMMAEAYDLLRTLYKLKAPDIADIFATYNKGKLQSYLFEISIPVLTKKDEMAPTSAKATAGKKGYLIDHILDKAGQKGTGRWTVADAVDRGVAIPSIAEAVFARTISSQKNLRMALAKKYPSLMKGRLARPVWSPGKLRPPEADGDGLKKFVQLLEDALYTGLLSAYAQGYDLITSGGREEQWNIDLAEVSRIWEGGCIIRAKLLNILHTAYGEMNNKQAHLLSIPAIVQSVKKTVPALVQTIALASTNGVAVPSLAMSLNYIISLTTATGPANFIQGLRDYFGAHEYERTNKPGKFHTNWK